MFLESRSKLLTQVGAHIEYLALGLSLLSVGALPSSLAFEFGRTIGRAAGAVLGKYRRRAEENLRFAYPEKSGAWIARTATECFEHFGQLAMEIAKAPRMPSGDRWRSMVEVVNEERTLEVAKRGKGIIFTGGHLGNWEIAAQWAGSRGLRTTSVAHRLKNEAVTNLMSRERRSRGNTTVEIDGAFRGLIRALKRGDMTAMLTDRNPRDMGIVVPFFGRDILTVTAPALLSLATGAPIVPFACLRSGGALRYRLHFGEPLYPDKSAPRSAEVERLTRESTRGLENHIRLAPGQWQWMHRRWKITPGGLERARAAERPPHPQSAPGETVGVR